MGKLIVFEGIDGSGKSTQFKKICQRFDAENSDFQQLVFPQYSEPSSALLKMYLNGEFGTDPESVNPYAASTFYAVDRYASFMKVWRDYYNNGGIMLADRYTTSNAIHQGSKLAEPDRFEFFKWLYEFEFKLMELPKPDIVIYMNVPLQTAISQMRSREEKTNTKGDIHETHNEYLEKCRVCGLQAAEYYGWKVINCAEYGKMREIEDIHNEIYDIITKEVL